MIKKVLILLTLLSILVSLFTVPPAFASGGSTINSGELKYDMTAEPYHINGYISPNCNFDKDMGRGLLQGYIVELVGIGTNATTDGSGYFALSGLANGTYTLKITKNGCLTKIIPNIVIKDGSVNISSLSSPIKTYIGDINNDNAINLSDVVEIAKVFNCKDGDGKYNTKFDLNVDGVVNLMDVMIIAKNFNKAGDSIPTKNDYTIHIRNNTITRDYVYTPLPGFDKIDQYGPGELGFYIVVFSGPINDSMKSDAELAGAKLYSYEPDFGLIATIATEDVEKVKSLPCVLDVLIYQNEYKVTDRKLLGEYSGEVIVGFYGTSDGIYDLTQKIDGVVVKRVWKSGALLEIDKGKVYELCKFPQIQYIQPNYEYTFG